MFASTLPSKEELDGVKSKVCSRHSKWVFLLDGNTNLYGNDTNANRRVSMRKESNPNKIDVYSVRWFKKVGKGKRKVTF